MKNIIIVLLFLIAQQSFCQEVKTFFIAKDSLGKDDDFVISRLIILSKTEFTYPDNVYIFRDPDESDFGFAQVEKYNADNNKFVPFNSIEHIDKINWSDKNAVLKKGTSINLTFKLVNTYSCKEGLYRARVKILFSKYNRSQKDVTTEWSYFYIK